MHNKPNHSNMKVNLMTTSINIYQFKDMRVEEVMSREIHVIHEESRIDYHTQSAGLPTHWLIINSVGCLTRVISPADIICQLPSLDVRVDQPLVASMIKTAPSRPVHFDCKLSEIVEALASTPAGFVAVVDTSERPIGLLTQGQLLRLAEDNSTALRRWVHQIRSLLAALRIALRLINTDVVDGEVRSLLIEVVNDLNKMISPSEKSTKVGLGSHLP